MAGTLYLVATPIGNLEDLTFRARRVLADVNVIACEDTRHTRTLLTHYGIATPTVSYHEHNEPARAADLLGRLRRGEDVALVSDAGMPALSDPGYIVIREAIAAGIAVVPIPGPSAVTAALTASGLPPDRFLFLGFLPRRSGERRRALAQVAEVPWTLVLFEAPHRITAVLHGLHDVLGDRRIVLARELTKRFEEFFRGTVSQALVHLRTHAPRGEFTIVVEGIGAERGRSSSLRGPRAVIASTKAAIAGTSTVIASGAHPVIASGAKRSLPTTDDERMDPAARMRALLAAGTPPTRAVAEVARTSRLSRRDAYQLMLLVRGKQSLRAKRSNPPQTDEKEDH